MELGEKLRQARLEAGLSQRQLSGEEITRNMLSLIENGSAKPSMKTLQYLAARLGKSVSYFLEDTAVVSPNQEVIVSLRKLYDSGNYREAYLLLKNYRSPDEVYDREAALLQVLIRLELAGEAIAERRFLYAAELLEHTPIQTFCCTEALQRRKLLLLGSIPGQKVAHQLPDIDEELLLRAEEAYSNEDFLRSMHLLEAMEQQNTPRWHLLRGKLCMVQSEWAQAIHHLRTAEETYPNEIFPKLEICFRETGDYQHAYEYACKQRK